MPLNLLPKAGPSIAAITGMGKCCKRVMKALPLNAKGVLSRSKESEISSLAHKQR